MTYSKANVHVLSSGLIYCGGDGKRAGRQGIRRIGGILVVALNLRDM